MEQLNIIKIGGNVIDSKPALRQFLRDFSILKGPKLLVHGGGKMASEMSRRMGIEPRVIDGRRVTDLATLEVVTMIYGGLINRNIVADLQAKKCNAIGLSGADANLIPATKRKKIDDIDYGYVGDVEPSNINTKILLSFLETGLTPIIAPLTHDKQGFLLNTNADTIASSIAVALSAYFEVTLSYCFEKNGVLADVNDEDSLIPKLNEEDYLRLKAEGVIVDGMIPKLDNAFSALKKGVKAVTIGDADAIETMVNKLPFSGTVLMK